MLLLVIFLFLVEFFCLDVFVLFIEILVILDVLGMVLEDDGL